nr:reverse transcriptase domain-containing protein [Tanacetum cinerariifolium]
PNNQIPPSVPNEFSSYIKLNEIAIKSMQNQINVLRGDFSKQEENLRRNLNDDMRNILSSFFQNQPLTLGTLPSNTIPNPKGEMKVVTTRSGLAYEGPLIPTKSHLEKVDEQNTEEILDKEHSNSSGSTAQIQPLVVPILILFADALLLRLKFASTIKSLLANKDKLFELAKVPLNENCSAMLLKKLPEKLGDPELTPTRMTLELADRSITRPKGVVEDVFVKVGKFHFPTDFVVVDFEADPRVPLILGRSFLRTGRALIDVYGYEITLRVNDESVTFNLDQVMKYFDNSVKRVNVINIASEEVVHDNTKSSNLTLVYESDFCEDPIVKISPFGESDFFLEEIEDILNDDSIPAGIENSLYDPEGDILYFKNLLKEDPFQLPLMNLNQAKSSIEEPEYSFSMGYEHLITTPVTELDEVAESSVKNLVPIQSEYEVTSDNESEYNEPINDDSFSSFTTFTNSLFNDKDDLTSNDNELIHDENVPIEEFKVYSNPLYDDDKIYSNELESHFQDNDSQREEIDIVIDTDELLPPGFENDDSEGEIYVLEELRVDNSIPIFENELSDNEASDFNNLSFPRPPLEPPDVEFEFEPDVGEVIIAVMNDIKNLIDDECFGPGGEIDVSTKVEDDDYFPFTFVIRIFLSYLIYPEVFLLLLSAESEDTIFDPSISI